MNIKEYQEKIEEILVKTLKKTPKKKIGILFSGGIDSLMLAVYLKKLKYNFTCYTSAYK